jgi:sec-independent protein translocase protein TatA
MPDLGVPELLIIAFIVVLLFGSKKLPDAARSVGRSMRIFKAETKGLREDDAPATPQIANTQPAQPPLPTAPPAPASEVHAAPTADADRR